ncbi:MAG: zinc-binding dehydrogenase [Actinomycetota bacterium]
MDITIADRPGGLPDVMRAVLLTGHGGLEMLDVRDDVPVPLARDGELLIEVAACGLNNTDINTRVGWYSRSVTEATSGDGFAETWPDDASWGSGGVVFPRIQGADPCGRVVAVGDRVDPSLLGRRVVVDPWIRDPERPHDRSLAGYLGSEFDGGFAEFCRVPAVNAHVVSVGESVVSDVELAGLACSWSTAMHMLERVELAMGQRIAVTGASGGVGTALVGLAALKGADVTAISSASKSDAVATLGADRVVARDVDDVAAAAVDAAGGPFDVVADVVGGPDVGVWLDALDRGGRYVTSGAIAGPIVDVDLRVLYLNDLEMIGATVFPPPVFEALVGLVNDGSVVPPIAATFPLEAIGTAQAAFARKDHVGAIVLEIAGSPSGPR